MQFPAALQGESLKRLSQGAFVGFVATAIIGFNWGGWTLGSTAKLMAEKSALTAVVAVTCTEHAVEIGLIKPPTQPATDATDTQRLMALAGREV